VVGDEEARALDLALSQSRFRNRNERLRRSAESYGFEAAARVPFTCECVDPDCREVVMLRLNEYERIRAQPTWFLLAAGHEDDESPHERVIEAENGYAIAEKTGAAGVEAARLWTK
jgi:hypothetical protein